MLLRAARVNGLLGSVVMSVVHVPVRTIKRPALNTSQLKEGRRTGSLAMKVGMLTIWDKYAVRHAVTVLQLDNCQVVQVKTDDLNGYTALQLGVGEAKLKRVNKALLGHYKKSNIEKPNRKLSEFRVTPDAIVPVGTKIRAVHFVPGQLVDVCGTSKGKGFAGVMKRWNFGGGRATHGNSLAHRIPGSTGCRQDPGRVFKNKKMPGRLGGERVTVQNLVVLKIDTQRDLLYVKGAVPGPKGGWIRVCDAVKGPFHPTTPAFPTFLNDVKDLDKQLYAPAGEKDVLLQTEPPDPY